MSREQIRQQADRLRSVPLKSVLLRCGARPDPHDKDKWHTSRGSLSLTGSKFFNWNQDCGGGGAIDLVIHLHRCRFITALRWLERHFPEHRLGESEPTPSASIQAFCARAPSLKLPRSDAAQLASVRAYLLTQRRLPCDLIDPLIRSGCLYADNRANAVFVLRAEDGKPVGAELRGTASAQSPWRGMSPGSKKDLGYFSVPDGIDPSAVLDRSECRAMILCESAIDAISCLALHPGTRCLSTSGARPNPAWLCSLIAQGHPVYCGFDADQTGERMAKTMKALHPKVRRLRPLRGDWNDLLRSRT